MEEVLWDAVEALAAAINYRNCTPDHSLRVADYAVRIAEAAGLHGQALAELRLGALLHDIGHIFYPDTLIEKQFASLTTEEREIIESHTSRGIELIQRWPALQFALPYILYHQEWFDGNGYPNGLSGDAIPTEVQIVSIADIYEALRHSRSYRGRAGMTHQDAIEIMQGWRGKRWRPDLFDMFVDIAKGWD